MEDATIFLQVSLLTQPVRRVVTKRKAEDTIFAVHRTMLAISPIWRTMARLPQSPALDKEGQTIDRPIIFPDTPAEDIALLFHFIYFRYDFSVQFFLPR